jgi:hypothetical protein
MEAWVKPEVTNAFIFGKATHNAAQSVYEGWLVYFSETSTTMRRGHNLEAPPIPMHEFSHIVVTYDGVTASMYIDGESVADRAVSDAVVQHTDPFTLGRTDNWKLFEGTIDDVSVYDYNLSPSRVKAHYDAGVGNSD